MSRVLVFSRDPGGANTVIPLVQPLRERGLDVLLYGKDVALDRYRQAGFAGMDVMTLLPEVTPDAVRRFVEYAAPEAIVTGTSADDFTEKFIWKAGAELGIPSMAIMDQWSNYGLRFSRHGVNDIGEYARERSHPYLPTLIVAMDDHARGEMIAEGLPQERIVVCGQPYFETVKASRNESDAIARFNAIAGIAPEDFVVLFASEPLTTTYGAGALSYWGYTELTILSALISSLERIAGETGRRIALIVRPHPKEGQEHFAEVIGRCRHVRCCFDSESTPWTLMNRADLVCGMSSMFLIESVILGRPVLSIQIGLRREDPFVLARRGITQSIATQEELETRLRNIIVHGEAAIATFEVIRNPVERIITEMEKLLCPSSQ